MTCPDCGRSYKDSPDHWVPKCVLQHAIRNYLLVAHRSIIKIGQFVDEEVCHCNPANPGEVRVKGETDE